MSKNKMTPEELAKYICYDDGGEYISNKDLLYDAAKYIEKARMMLDACETVDLVRMADSLLKGIHDYAPYTK